jgi:hypothetical protein
MLKPSELRIGNHVKFPHQKEDEFIVIEGIRGTSIYYKTPAGITVNTDLENLVPVPITVPQLISFGFTKDDSGVEPQHQDYCEWYEKEFPVIGKLVLSDTKEYLFDENSDTLRIWFVHRLQNLIADLNNEER